MKFDKKVLCSLNMPYALGSFMIGNELCIVGATEDHGPIMVSKPPYDTATELISGPGGCMALISHERQPGVLFAIMGCFVGYKFQTGAVYRIGPAGSPAGAATESWGSVLIAELPFAHRIELVERPAGSFLVAASIAADKKDGADWSKAGTLYAAERPKGNAAQWRLVPILEGIHKNHGLLAARFQGRRTLLVSGTEGLYAIDLDAPGTAWNPKKIIEREISEIAVLDVDGDGKDEILTIEPFHGNAVRVSKESGGSWEPVWEAPIEFGHCLLGAQIGGLPSILVSNRAGTKDLLLFQFDPLSSRMKSALPEPKRAVIETGAGAANILVVPHKGRELIFSTNQVDGQIVRYSVSA